VIVNDAKSRSFECQFSYGRDEARGEVDCGLSKS